MMFSKLSALALFAPLVAGTITLSIPKTPTSAASVTITWTFAPTDPPFSLELVNEIFHNQFAIANNILPTDGQITLTLPAVPDGAGYTLEAVNIGNINDVYSSTGSFSIAANTATSTTSSGTGTSTGTGTSSGASSTGVSVTSHAPATTSGFGTTVVGTGTTNTAPAVTTSKTSSSAPTTTGGAFNGASTFKMNSQVGAFAAAFFSAVAGAAVFVL